MPVDLRLIVTRAWWPSVEVSACATAGLGALYGVTIVLIRESPSIGASAAVTASLNAGSLTDPVLLVKMRTKFDVALPVASSDEIRLPARADSRLLVSGPPLVSVPPMSRPAMDMASRTPDPASVAHRYRYTKRPQLANMSPSLTHALKRADLMDRRLTEPSLRAHRPPRRR